MTQFQLQIRDFDTAEGWRTVKTVRTMKEAIAWKTQIMEDTGDEYDDVRIHRDDEGREFCQPLDGMPI